MIAMRLDSMRVQQFHDTDVEMTLRLERQAVHIIRGLQSAIRAHELASWSKSVLDILVYWLLRYPGFSVDI